jgi:hypothetical protein
LTEARIAAEPHAACALPLKEDCAALRELPQKELDVWRYERYRADKYGNITVEGKYRYSTAPQFVARSLLVGLSASLRGESVR